MKDVLKFEHLYVNYGKKEILKDIDFTVRKGEIVGIAGESGCGKSTLLRTVTGLLENTGHVVSGHVLYGDRILDTMTDSDYRQLRGMKISMIFQDAISSFCPVIKIKRHLYDMAAAHGKSDKADVRKQILNIFKRLNLSDGERILNSYAFELSGGMCQRVSIAMAMVFKPDFLLADEPTSALDVTAAAQVADELMKLRDTFETGILVVSHDIKLLSAITDRIGVMSQGRLVESGRTETVLCNSKHSYTKKMMEDAALLNALPMKQMKTRCAMDSD